MSAGKNCQKNLSKNFRPKKFDRKNFDKKKEKPIENKIQSTSLKNYLFDAGLPSSADSISFFVIGFSSLSFSGSINETSLE